MLLILLVQQVTKNNEKETKIIYYMILFFCLFLRKALKNTIFGNHFILFISYQLVLVLLRLLLALHRGGRERLPCERCVPCDLCEVGLHREFRGVGGFALQPGRGGS